MEALIAIYIVITNKNQIMNWWINYTFYFIFLKIKHGLVFVDHLKLGLFLKAIRLILWLVDIHATKGQ